MNALEVRSALTGEGWSSARGTHVELRLGVVDSLHIKGVNAAASGPERGTGGRLELSGMGDETPSEW